MLYLSAILLALWWIVSGDVASALALLDDGVARAEGVLQSHRPAVGEAVAGLGWIIPPRQRIAEAKDARFDVIRDEG